MSTPDCTALVYVDGSAYETCVWFDSDAVPIVETWSSSTTGNRREYLAVLRALELAVERGVQAITVCSDSELVVKQLNGEYKTRSPELEYYSKLIAQLVPGKIFARFIWVAREDNLAGITLEKRSKLFEKRQ